MIPPRESRLAPLLVILSKCLHGVSAFPWQIESHTVSAKCSNIGQGRQTQCEVFPGDLGDATAKGVWIDDNDLAGFSRLTIKVPRADPNHAAFAAGYLEGYLTADLVVDHLQTNIYNSDLSRSAFRDQVRSLWTWWKTSLIAADAQDDYWRWAGFFFNQMQGISHGINDALGNCSSRGTINRLPESKCDLEVTPLDILVASLLLETDLKPTVNSTIREYSKSSVPGKMQEHSVKNVLLTMLPDGSDVLAKHILSTKPGRRLLYKRYELGTRPPVTMMSEPGRCFSSDGFYQVGKLAIMSATPYQIPLSITSIGQFSLPATIRSMIANMLAEIGPDWFEAFSRHQKGDLSEWAVVDYRQFSQGRPLKHGFLTVGGLSIKSFWCHDHTRALSQSKHIALWRPETRTNQANSLHFGGDFLDVSFAPAPSLTVRKAAKRLCDESAHQSRLSIVETNSAASRPVLEECVSWAGIQSELTLIRLRPRAHGAQNISVSAGTYFPYKSWVVTGPTLSAEPCAPTENGMADCGVVILVVLLMAGPVLVTLMVVSWVSYMANMENAEDQGYYFKQLDDGDGTPQSTEAGQSPTSAFASVNSCSLSSTDLSPQSNVEHFVRPVPAG